MKPERLDHLLSRIGVCSRREVGRVVREGRVTVAGAVVKFDAKVDPQAVWVDGVPIEAPDGLLILLHKPRGVVCTHATNEGPRVFDLIPAAWRRRDLTTVGRLDQDTTGALLLTDRGDWVHAWAHPKRHVEKVYVVTVDRPVDEAGVASFARGLVLADGPCRPCVLEFVDEFVVRLTLTEGRHHQVKRMFAKVGREVVALHRESFGLYGVLDLDEGLCRRVEPEGVAVR